MCVWFCARVCFRVHHTPRCRQILIPHFTYPPSRPPVCFHSRALQHPSLTKDLNYNVDDAILRKRVHTPIISKKPFNPLRNE